MNETFIVDMLNLGQYKAIIDAGLQDAAKKHIGTITNAETRRRLIANNLPLFEVRGETLSREQIQAMTPEQINANWETVKKSLPYIK